MSTRKKIVIIGLGALGSHAALFARSLDVDLVLVDFDRVEAKNTLGQFHVKGSLGKNKAMALDQSLQFLFGRRSTVIPHRLVPDNVEAILGGATVIVDCTDNGDARRTIQGYAQPRAIPTVHAGIAADGSYARIVWTDDFVADDGNGGATCEDGLNLPFHGIVGAHVADVLATFLGTGRKTNRGLTRTSVLSF